MRSAQVREARPRREQAVEVVGPVAKDMCMEAVDKHTCGVMKAQKAMKLLPLSSGLHM